MPNEPALLDTNVLVYALFQNAAQHAASRALVERAVHKDAALFVAAQSMAEFFATITNPRRVTDPKTPLDAVDAVERLLALPGLQLLTQPTDAVQRWCELVRQHPVKGGDVFDLQILAVMQACGIRCIYTFNRSDFEWFAPIQVLIP